MIKTDMLSQDNDAMLESTLDVSTLALVRDHYTMKTVVSGKYVVAYRITGMTLNATLIREVDGSIPRTIPVDVLRFLRKEAQIFDRQFVKSNLL